MKRINAATSFAPKQLAPNEETQSVVLIGRLRTQVNGVDTATDTKSYLAEFAYAGGRVHLNEARVKAARDEVSSGMDPQ